MKTLASFAGKRGTSVRLVSFTVFCRLTISLFKTICDAGGRKGSSISSKWRRLTLFVGLLLVLPPLVLHERETHLTAYFASLPEAERKWLNFGYEFWAESIEERGGKFLCSRDPRKRRALSMSWKKERNELIFAPLTLDTERFFLVTFKSLCLGLSLRNISYSLCFLWSTSHRLLFEGRSGFFPFHTKDVMKEEKY